MTPQERAKQVALAMMAKDKASRSLGMNVTHIAPGAATLTLRVSEDMLNGHNMCHGGYIFTLADSAFAFACNSYNRLTVAQQNQITYISPGQLGEMLTATATETALAGRSGVYDVLVHGEDGRTVATMRGLSRTIKGQIFDESGDNT
jgi:acyl-CoA thioesterase